MEFSRLFSVQPCLADDADGARSTKSYGKLPLSHQNPDLQDLVQHLESIVIHWTRQIKDVVNNHENALSAEILGPLEEIEVMVLALLSRIRLKG